jgi:hypothetical protein
MAAARTGKICCIVHENDQVAYATHTEHGRRVRVGQPDGLEQNQQVETLINFVWIPAVKQSPDEVISSSLLSTSFEAQTHYFENPTLTAFVFCSFSE